MKLAKSVALVFAVTALKAARPHNARRSVFGVAAFGTADVGPA
jgi:hypothetical protein